MANGSQTLLPARHSFTSEHVKPFPIYPAKQEQAKLGRKRGEMANLLKRDVGENTWNVPAVCVGAKCKLRTRLNRIIERESNRVSHSRIDKIVK